MLAALWSCLSCAETPVLTLGGRRLHLERLLGEGGFAYVYLVIDVQTHEQFALKRIRCVFGGESVAAAMREVDACTRFRATPRVVSCLDSQVRQEADGTKTVDILFPYYVRGSLQERITDNAIKGAFFPEREVREYALGIACAIAEMHHYRELDAGGINAGANSGANAGAAPTPYAHRDIKPANVLFDESDTPVLVDLGSTSPARVHVGSRHVALEVQELAAEHCTLPYRAPELFDVRTGTTITESVDVWGFGCTVYTAMYAVSPFEREELAGGSITIAIARGNFSFPARPAYSQALRDLVKQCISVDPAQRPSIDEVAQALRALPPL